MRLESERGEPQRLSQTLARRSGLTDGDLKRISMVQDQLGLGFIEAAMRLGLRIRIVHTDREIPADVKMLIAPCETGSAKGPVMRSVPCS